MTDNPSGENDIESLAQRAKEVLDRVRANTDDVDPSSVSPSEIAPSTPDVDADVPGTIELPAESVDVADPAETSGYIAGMGTQLDGGVGDIDLPEPSVAQAEVPDDPGSDIADLIEGDLAELDDALNADLHAEVGDLDGVDDLGTEESAAFALDADLDTDIASISDDVADGNEGLTSSAAAISTALVPTNTFDAESLRSDDEENEDRRKFGCLLPLLLLALLILALIYLASQVFGDDDDPVLVDGPSSDVTQPEVEANDLQTSVEPTNTTATTGSTTTTSTTTSTTTTTEPPVVIPGSTWELLGASSETDLFAAFGEPFGLRETLEQPDGAEFTVFAPSNDAISALSQEAIGGFADDPASAEALLGYHIIDQRLTPDLLLASAGGQIESRVGLPIDVSIDGDDIVLNGSSRISLDALEAGNGNVVVIDSVLTPPTINSVINLGDVQFEVISAIITDAGKAELQKAVTFFRESPDANAVIEGHTDTDGPSEPNQRLSERRAEAVRAFLISEGIDGARLTAEGFGESQPIIVNGVEDKAASRRIEFNIR